MARELPWMLEGAKLGISDGLLPDSFMQLVSALCNSYRKENKIK